MFVDSVLCSDSDLSLENGITWEHIERAISALDGRKNSEVSLGRVETESHMSITGGPTHFLVSATLDNDVFYDLINPQGDPNATVTLVSGGQQTTVRLSEVVDRETALSVARIFAEEGRIDSTKSWSRNPPEDQP
jgi:hypothetical protein